MKGKFKLLAFAAAFSLALSGCTLPGEKAQAGGEDDYFDNTTVITEAAAQEEAVNYKWVLKPSLSCDNIITPDLSVFDPANIKRKAYLYTSIIIQDGLFGFVDLNGNMAVYPEYQNYYYGSDGTVYLSSPAEDGKVKVCWLDDYLRRQEEYIEPELIRLKSYYWNEAEEKIYVTDSDSSVVPFNSDDTVAVCKADIVSNSSGGLSAINIESDSYALADSTGLLSDFEYEDCYLTSYGDPSESLIALKKNGRWGYTDEAGNVVLDFKFYDMPSAYSHNFANSDERSHPNLYSEGYVAVQNEKGGGYYTADGSVLIPTGTFQQARPIQSGRAWVSINGLWGIITLGEISDLKMPKVTTTTTTTAATTTSQSWTWTTTTTAPVTQAPETTAVVTMPTTAATTEQLSETTPAETTPAAVVTTPEVISQSDQQPAASVSQSGAAENPAQ